MGIPRFLKKIAVLPVLLLCCLTVCAQVRISGTVYDRTAKIGISGVSVLNSAGGGTVTDSAGRYTIQLGTKDSLSFSYQGKATQKFPVKEINARRAYDVSLHVDVHTLPTVTVSAPPLSYSFDSLQHRNEYRKYFDLAPEYLMSGNGGAGVNLDALFSLRKIKRMEVFRGRLERYEQEKYVDHRFNKDLVQKITGLESPALDAFMRMYRPNYMMLQHFENEYAYYQYIKDAGRYFAEQWNIEHPRR
ncbi:carboxypeptidase-like regulatory domain-containing protein [Chitinophaga agrisoli]|uniref:Carboxypeptidase-like regulatory domain-containing protein n=1 Tax=Chitinophaga agrisoli TaxID=2607653 RepID=A0A5B2VIY8_9BACT|nr:carboxypeptidase-like regulatory domain-containing protein [Chitinophaga agrisoli]KAA2239031.1 carboxypeptidase-like regulatory domain-containing protein [Chitinophaga agrisoli]